MFSENCFCTLKEIQVGFHEFSRNRKKLLQIFSHDLWAWNQKIVIHRIWNPRACIHEDCEKVKLNRKKYSERIIMSFKQRKIKFKPRKKLNHNIYTRNQLTRPQSSLLRKERSVSPFSRETTGDESEKSTLAFARKREISNWSV